MKRIITFFTLFLALCLTGCTMLSPPLDPGATEQAVVERYGRPTAIYPNGETAMWEYSGGYWSQETHMARMDRDKRLISWEQVRTDAKFATLTIGKSTANDVLKTVGTPTETSQIHLNNYKVWTYRYKQDGVWDSMMHVMFDDDGIVQKMEIGRDPMYDGDKRGWGRPGIGIGIGSGGRRGGVGIGIGF